MDMVQKKQTKTVKVNYGQQVLRQEQKLAGDNLESIQEMAGWKNISDIMQNQVLEEIGFILESREDKDVLIATKNIKAILNFANSIKIKIDKGNIARKLLEDSFRTNKPCR